MKQEVEIQVKIKNPSEVEKNIRKIGKFRNIKKQIDKYFVLPQRNFFSKNPPIEYLRIRYEKNKNHLNYSFLHFDESGWLKATDEYETIIEKPETVEKIFKKIGLILTVTVAKERKYFDYGNFEITLDKVKGLGNFMEIEAKKNLSSLKKTRESCFKLLKSLRIEYILTKDSGYPRLLYQKLKSKK